MRNKSTKDNPGTLPINCYFAKPYEPQPVDFDNLLSMASASDEEDPVAPSPSNLFGKDAFVMIKPGYRSHLDYQKHPSFWANVRTT